VATCGRKREAGPSVLGRGGEGERRERKREGERFAAMIAKGGRAWATSDHVTRDGTAVRRKREGFGRREKNR